MGADYNRIAGAIGAPTNVDYNAIAARAAKEQSRQNGSGAASIINSVGSLLSGLGDAIGTIITSVGTSRAIQSGDWWSKYNQGENNNINMTIALVAIAAVGVLVVVKK